MRLAQVYDTPSIEAIYEDATALGYATCDFGALTRGERQEWLEHHTEPYGVWVAEKREDIVGWIALSPYDRKKCFRKTGSVATYVANGFRSQGVGTQLRSHLIEQARHRGFHALIARAWATNTASRRLSERFGWKQVGCLREVVYVGGRFVDCLIFEFLLTEP